MKTVYSFIVLFITFFALVSCDATKVDSDKNEETYVMSGSVAGPNVTAKKSVYAGLFTAGAIDFTTTPIFSTLITLDLNSKGLYSVSGIKKGTYSAGIFIDMDGNKKLSSGDYCTYMTSGEIPGFTSPGDVVIEKDYELNILSTHFFLFFTGSESKDTSKESVIYFKKPADWNAVYVHYWNNSSESKWPGIKMDLYSDDWYKITMKNLETGTYFSNYVFNNGDPIFDEDKTIDTEWDKATGWCIPGNENTKAKTVQWSSTKL